MHKSLDKIDLLHNRIGVVQAKEFYLMTASAATRARARSKGSAGSSDGDVDPFANASSSMNCMQTIDSVTVRPVFASCTSLDVPYQDWKSRRSSMRAAGVAEMFLLTVLHFYIL